MKTTKTKFKARNAHLIDGFKDYCFGYYGIRFKDGSEKRIHYKEAWRLGYLTWIDIQFAGENGRQGFRANIEEIFDRWIRFKKEASKDECKAVFAKLKATIPQWLDSTRYYEPHFGRCGIYWKKYNWENKPYKCPICNEYLETVEYKTIHSIFCHKHLRHFLKFIDKEKYSNLTYDEGAAVYIDNQMSKVVKQIERGKYNGIARTGN
jgi:hypothetical protein